MRGNIRNRGGDDPKMDDWLDRTDSSRLAALMEEGNNDQVDVLRGQVAQLKSMTQDIHGELKEHNSLLDSIQSEMERVRDVLRGSMAELQKLAKTAESRHMVYLFLFCIFFFYGVYKITKK